MEKRIQFFAPPGTLGAFMSELGAGRFCLSAYANVPGADGVLLQLIASPGQGPLQMPTEEACKVFNDARRLIEASDDLLASLKEVVAEADAYEAKHGPMNRPWVRMARGAIKKAEGGAT